MAKRKVQSVPGDGTYGNGSIRQRGDRWQVRWRENGQRMSTSGFKSTQEARDELAKIQARLQLGERGLTPEETPDPVQTPSHDQSVSFDDLLDDWTAYRVTHKRRMAKEERSRWDRHLAKPLETQTVRGLTTKWVRAVAEELVAPTPGTKAPDGTRKTPISGPTAHRVLTLLSSFYGWAIREGFAEANPVRPALRDPDMKALLKSTHDKDAGTYLKSWAEVDRLYRAMRLTSVGIGFYLQARAGLRPGEAYALRWGSVDLDAKTMTVRSSVRFGKEGPTKGGKPRRVPIAPKLGAELAKWKADSAPHTSDVDLVCPPPFRIMPNGAVSRERLGRFLGPTSIDKAISAAFQSTGIKPSTMYAYGRHSFASILGLSGAVSAPRLQAIMGHQDIKTTLRYVSLANQALTKAELGAFG